MNEHSDPFLKPSHLEFSVADGTARLTLGEYLNLLSDEPRGLADGFAGDAGQTADYLNAVINGELRKVGVALMIANLVHKRFDGGSSAAFGTLTDYLTSARSMAEQDTT